MTSFIVIQPTDLDPTCFDVDPTSKQVTLTESVLNNQDLTYMTSANVSGETALMFMPGQLVEAADPTISSIYCGVSLTAASSGASVSVRRQGLMTADTWNWQPYMPIFVGPNGALTRMAPTSGWSRIIGYALEAQTIFLAPEHLIHVED